MKIFKESDLNIEILKKRIHQSEQDFKDGNFKTSEQLLKRFSKFEEPKK